MQTLYPRRFGRYVLVELLGLGGMGEVALALCGSRSSPQLCVIKRLFPDCRGDRVIEERFRREGDLVAQLSHRGLPLTLEVGTCEGEQFIAQEFIAGRDLGQVLASCASKEERLPVSLALYVVTQVAEALAYVHDVGNLGVVHRDVSPSNVRLSWQGEVKLIDFGIARAAAQAGLTLTGHSVGRPKYMAPELLAGGQATRATDVYALGVVLWEMLMGRGFGEGEVALAEANSDIPWGLEDAVMKAITAIPNRRYPNTKALRAALEPYLPKDFAGEGELREFLAERWDVARENRLREAAIESARALLDEEPIRRASETAKVRDLPGEGIPEIPRRRAWMWTAGAAVMVVAAIAAGKWYTGGPDEARVNRGGGGERAAGSVGGDAGGDDSGSGERGAEDGGSSRAIPHGGLGTDSLPYQPPSAARTPVAQNAGGSKVRIVKVQAGALLDDAQEAYRAGAVEQAIGLARRAARSGGGARAHIMAGRMLVHENRMAEAEAEFAAAKRLAPGNQEAAQWLARIRAGRE